MDWRTEAELRVSEGIEIVYKHVEEENKGMHGTELELIMCRKAKTLLDSILAKCWRKLEESWIAKSDSGEDKKEEE